MPITQIIYAAVLVAFLGLGGYCKYLKSENTVLEHQVVAIKLVDSQKDEDILTCNTRTEELKVYGETISKNAQVAIEVAKVEAVADYKYSQTVLHRKPKPVVVLPEQVVNFGGADIEVQKKDYLASHDLINEYIDSHGAKK